MANVLTFPTALLELTDRTPEAIREVASPRNDYRTELSIAATRFELAVGVGSMVGGLVGLGIGATAGCIVGAVPASAVGAVVGAAALGIPVGIYSLIQMNNAMASGPKLALV